MNGLDKLTALRRHRAFLVGVDSDGTVFDTMVFKQMHCLFPAMVETWHLQELGEWIAKVVEFVGLKSWWRGSNRYRALLLEFRLLALCLDENRRRRLPSPEPLAAWINSGAVLSLDGLRLEALRTRDPFLAQVVAWSESTDRKIADGLQNAPLFPAAVNGLSIMARQADLAVVSTTPEAALRRDWSRLALTVQPRIIAGQETGDKLRQLTALIHGGYQAGHVLMIGDAPGDLRAAKAAGVHFFPIEPGREDNSWQRLIREGWPRFMAGEFTDDFEEGLIADFKRLLSTKPAWLPADCDLLLDAPEYS